MLKDKSLNIRAAASTGSPELLSPAGDINCLYAAVAAGCDAVYAGCNKYGARAYAANFTPEELIYAIGYMHLFGRKLYLTLNTLIKPDEFEDLHDFVKPFYLEGLDGIIVQDTGVIRLLKESFPGMEIHASTQMSVSSSYGVRLLQDMGVKRVVPARELSLGEIKEIREATGAELECFVHGAMCYSYSGMCLMSSMLGGRSGNRGRCAGPCRQPYSVKGTGVKDSYILSMKDLCAIDILGDLIKSGISSFKIEGRMKSKEYVYGVTKIYREAVDRILNDPEKPYKANGEDRKKLIRLYSRGGISGGYYERHNGPELVTFEKGAYIREDTEKADFEKKRIGVSAQLAVAAGENIRLILSASKDKGITAEVSGVRAESAENRPLTEEELIKQLKKTGDTDFYFEDIRIDTDLRSFVRVSDINALRRKALTELREKLLYDHKRSM